jgi:hypothetical protein
LVQRSEDKSRKKYAWSKNTSHKPHNSYPPPNTVRPTKPANTGHVGYIPRTKTRKTKNVFFENFKEIQYLGCNFIDRVITLKYISET